jgi:uncharacterized RDD family membrane protein YckC
MKPLNLETRMKIRSLMLSVLVACGAVAGVGTAAWAAVPTPIAPPVAPAPPAPPTAAVPQTSASAADSGDADADNNDDRRGIRRRNGNGNVAFAIARDASLPAGRAADAVVSIGGNASSAGDVRDAVVAIVGDARATGPVGNSVVAILGDAYLNSSARSVVAVMGNVQLGPEARVSREIVAIGGTITRDPAAVVGGREQVVSIGRFGHLDGLRTWIKRCALLARPLALDANLYWAWGIAFGFLAFYALLALIFREPMQRCIETMEARPGQTVIASLLSLVLVPVAMLLLVMTIVGIIVVPFFGMALMLAALFGKAVMLAWIGRRVYRVEQPVMPLLIGGAIVLALYLVPMLGFLVYKLLGIMGLGVVAYTLLLNLRPPQTASASVVSDETARADAAGEGQAAAAGATTVAAAAAAVSGASPSAASLDYAALPRAGFGVRMGALFLDGALILIVTNLVVNPGARGFLGLLALYAAVMWQLKGTTIGGSIVGLKLVRTDGKPIDWATAIARALGCLLSLAIGGLGFLWILFDSDRQAWHDKIAGTAVVKVPKGVSLL